MSERRHGQFALTILKHLGAAHHHRSARSEHAATQARRRMRRAMPGPPLAIQVAGKCEVSPTAPAAGAD